MELTLLFNLLITIIAIILSYASNRNISLPSFSQFFVLFYFIFIVIGGYFLFFVKPFLYRDTLYLINYGFLFFCTGSFFSSVLNRFGSRDIDAFRQAPFVDSFLDRPTLIALTILIILSTIMSAYFFRSGIPFYSHDVDEARLEASHGGGYYYIGFAIFLPIVVLILRCKMFHTGSNTYRLLFSLTFLVCSTFQLLSGYRAPLLNLIGMLLILHNYLKGRFTVRFIISILFMFSAFFFGLTFWKWRHEVDILDLLESKFIQRVILVNPLAISIIVGIFPENTDFFLGRSYLMDFYSALPGPGISFGGWLFSQTPASDNYRIVMLTPTIIGEFYANFSFLGSLLLLFCFGYFVNTLFIRFIRARKQLVHFALWIPVSFALMNSAILGLGTTIVTRLLTFMTAFGLFYVLYVILSSARARAR